MELITYTAIENDWRVCCYMIPAGDMKIEVTPGWEDRYLLGKTFYFSINNKTRCIPQFKRFPLEVYKLILTGIWLCENCPSYKLGVRLPVIHRSEDGVFWKTDLWWLERGHE